MYKNYHVPVQRGPFVNEEHKQTIVAYYSGHINNTNLGKLRLILNFDKPDAMQKEIVNNEVRTLMVTITYNLMNANGINVPYSDIEGANDILKHCVVNDDLHLGDKIAITGLISPTLTNIQYVHPKFIKGVKLVDDDVPIKYPTPTVRMDDNRYSNALERYMQNEDWKNAQGDDIQTVTGRIINASIYNGSIRMIVEFWNTQEERSELVHNDGVTRATIYLSNTQLGTYELYKKLDSLFGHSWEKGCVRWENYEDAGLKICLKGLAYNGEGFEGREEFKMIPFAGMLMEKNDELKAPVMPRKIWRSYQLPF